MPLPRGLRAHQEGQRPGGIEAQLGEFVGRKPGLLDIDRMTQAAVLPAHPCRRSPCGKADRIGGGKRVVEVAGEIAAVGNANPKDVASFRQPRRDTFHGACVVIVRPTRESGAIEVRAEFAGDLLGIAPVGGARTFVEEGTIVASRHLMGPEASAAAQEPAQR